MNPAVLVRISLEGSRRRGLSFDAAWRWSTRDLPRPRGHMPADAQPNGTRTRREWANAIHWAREAFRAAYENEPDPGCEAMSHVTAALSAPRGEMFAAR